MRPSNIDQRPERLWDWRQPQFLAGFLRPPLPAAMSAIRFGSIDFSKPSLTAILVWWSAAETEYRWTDGKEAALLFGLAPVTDIQLQMKLSPFLRRER